MKASDFLNPIFVREIRAAVRNRMVSVCFCLNLILLCWTTFSTLLHPTTQKPDDIFYTSDGKNLFVLILLEEYLVGLAVVSLWTLCTTIRDGLGDEMIYTTPLPEPKFIYGKVYAAFIVLLLLYSSMLPFLCVAYYLRGVDLVEMLAIPPVLLLSSVAASYAVAVIAYRLENVQKCVLFLGGVLLTLICGGFIAFLPLTLPLFLLLLKGILGGSEFAVFLFELIPLALFSFYIYAISRIFIGVRLTTGQRIGIFILLTIVAAFVMVVAEICVRAAWGR